MSLNRRHLLQRLLILALLLLGPALLLRLIVQAMSPAVSGAIIQNNLLLTGHSGGGNQAIAINNDTAALANGSVLSLLDISNSSDPVREGILETDRAITALELQGDILYMGNSEQGLALVDASSPEAMSVGLTLLPNETVYDLERAENTLYVAHDSGLTAYDITDPANPISVTTISTAASWLRISPNGNRGLATNANNTVYVLDLTTPDQPVVQGGYELSGTPGGAAAVGNTAYVGWSDCAGGNCTAMFSVLDISNPEQPTLITERTVGNGLSLGVAAGGGYLYITRISSGSVHVGAALDVYDIALPSLPSFAADYDVPGTYGAFDIKLDAPDAYLAHGEAGFHILDVSDPTNPAADGIWAGPGRARALVLANDMAYIGANAPQDRAELWIQSYDGDNGPMTVGQFRIEQLRTVRDLAVDGNMAYVAGPNPLNTVGRVRLLDVSDPANPISLLSHETTNIEHIAAANGFAYIHDENGLQIVDFRDTANVMELYRHDIGGETVVKGNFAYIAGGSDGLQILNVISPVNASLAGTLQGNWSAESVAVNGNFAYLGVGNAGIRVIDVATPGSPVEVGQFDMGWQVNDVAIDGSYLVVGTAADGIQILDVSDPAALFVAATYMDDWIASDLVIAGETVLASADAQGIYRLAQRFSVEGRISELNGAGVPGISVALLGSNITISEPDGTYGLGGVPAGTYTIEPTHPSFIFSPTNRMVTVGPSAESQDFLMLPAPVSGEVGIGGGILSFVDTQGLTTTVTIPAGAVSETVTVMVTPTIVENQGNLQTLNHAFDLAVYVGGIIQPDYQFLIPIGVAIYYSDADLGVATEETIGLQQWQNPGWQEAGLSCDPATTGIVNVINNLFAQGICETGRYALFGPVQQLFLPIINRP